MSDNGAGTKQSGVELEPCPFCGGEATFVDAGSGLNYYVGCADDSCCGFAEVGWAFKTREEAVAAWNTRAERTCRWEVVKHGAIYDVYRCSACGYEYAESRTDKGVKVEWIDANFCPGCGAKVVG